MSNSKKIIKSTALIVILTLASKILGFLRETLIAYKFGSGMKTDTFFVALTATALITSLISSAISTTFIPVLSQIEAIEGREEKINHTNDFCTSYRKANGRRLFWRSIYSSSKANKVRITNDFI